MGLLCKKFGMLLIGLALAAWAWGETGQYRLTFRTQPENVTVSLHQPDGSYSTLPSQGQTVVLPPAALEEKALSFRLSHPAYQSADLGLTSELFGEPGNYLVPNETQVIALEPRLVELHLETEPTGAQVFAEPGHHYLGLSSHPLQLNLADLWQRGGEKVSLMVELSGYRSERVELTPEQLSGESLTESCRLVPQTVLAPFTLLAQRKPSLALLILSLTALATGAALRVASQAVRRRHRTRFLESMTDQDRSDPLTGSWLGPYYLTQKQATDLFRAIPESSQRFCLVRVLRGAHTENQHYRAAFEEEVSTLLKIDHPNVTRVLDWGEDRDILYLVTEDLEGESLDKRMARRSLELEEVMSILRPLLACLILAHKRGITHRALTPEAIVILPTGQVKLRGFGAAPHGFSGIDLAKSLEALADTTYAAPEQLQGGRLDGRSDQYALGVVLFQMLTGKPPIAGDSLGLAVARAVTPLPSLGETRPDLPPILSETVDRMLSKLPSDRFEDLKVVQERLKNL